MASWQQVHLITLRTSHLYSRKELGRSVWGDLWLQGRRGCLNSGATHLPPSTPVPRGTCPSPWPPRGCGDKVRKGQATKTGVTMERESQLRCGPPAIPFSLLWGVAAEICRHEQEEGGRAGQPAPRLPQDLRSHRACPACTHRADNMLRDFHHLRSVLSLQELYLSSPPPPEPPHSHPSVRAQPPRNPCRQGWGSCQEEPQLLSFAFKGLHNLLLPPVSPSLGRLPSPTVGHLLGATAELLLKVNSPQNQSHFLRSNASQYLKSFQIALVKINLHFPHIPVTPGASQTELHLFLTFPWEGKVRAASVLPSCSRKPTQCLHSRW